MWLGQGTVRGPRSSLLRSRLTTCALSPVKPSATTGFHRRSEDPGGRWPAGGFRACRLGVIAPWDAGRRETEDRPALLFAPVLACTFTTCGYCLSGAVAANRVVRSGPGCEGGVPDGQWRIGRQSTRPVLKHGPRSLTCAQVIGTLRNLKAK